MAWWKRASPKCSGVGFFPGAVPPRAEEYAPLAAAGYELERSPTKPGEAWVLGLKHSRWGKALFAQAFPIRPPPRPLLAMMAGLTADDCTRIAACGSGVSVFVEGEPGENSLRTRKRFLHYLRLMLAGSGVAGVDDLSHRFWTTTALDEELAHDADVDVEALYTWHCLVGDQADEEPATPAPPLWLHTHGLQEIGHFDFDVIRPDGELLTHKVDLLRAIACAIVEGELELDGDALHIAEPGYVVRAVDSGRFVRENGSAHGDWRALLDEEHLRGHAVLCEPAARGLSTIWKRSCQPSRFLSTGPEVGMVHFSKTSTDLMALRARATWSLLRALHQELEGLECQSLLKVGIPTDRDPALREHMWFEARALRDSSSTGELIVQPFDVAHLRQGASVELDVGELTDWMIQTPVGPLTPRDLTRLRVLRTHRAEIVEMLRARPTGA